MSLERIIEIMQGGADVRFEKNFVFINCLEAGVIEVYKWNADTCLYEEYWVADVMDEIIEMVMGGDDE